MRKLSVGILYRSFDYKINGVLHKFVVVEDFGIGLFYDYEGEMEFEFYKSEYGNDGIRFIVSNKIDREYSVGTRDIADINESKTSYRFKMQKIKEEFFTDENNPKFYLYDNEECAISRVTDLEMIHELEQEYEKIKHPNPKIPNGILKYGEVLTDRTFYCDPAIGRSKELELLKLGLVTPKKSPLLIGLPGVGKSAIVDGLAYQIQLGNVPDALNNKIIFNIDAASIISGCNLVGMVEENVKEILTAIRNKKEIIVFIDEFHTLIGLGQGSNSNIDVANMFKPYLASGQITLIGATTTEEYEKIICKDKAFARRFEVINVLEPSRETVIDILIGSLPYYENTTGIKFAFNDYETKEIFNIISNLTEYSNRIQNKLNPDISLEFLGKAFAYASLYNKESVGYEEIINAILISATVNETAKTEAIKQLRNLSEYQTPKRILENN